MRVEITVTHNGTVFFSTDPTRLWSKEKLRDVLQVMQKKFPKKEGFSISVMVDPCLHDYYASVNEFLRKHYPGPHYDY